MAGEDRLPASFRPRKLVPKCSAPLSTATAAIRPHWSRGGGLMNQTSISARIATRNAVNRNGGISCSAYAETRKFSAQNRQISRTRTRSRPTSPLNAGLMRSPAPAEAPVQLRQYPGGTDQEVAQVGEKAGLPALVQLAVADELGDPGHHEHADGQPQQPG